MHKFVAVANRVREQLTTRLRIDKPLAAHTACAFTATAIVAFIGFLLALSGLAFRDPVYFDLATFIVSGTFAWFGISIGGFVVAWPFVATATWVGKRFQIESFGYYVVSGGLTMSIPTFALFGAPQFGDPNLVNTSLEAWLIGPPCGASWGGCWWWIHRRWLAHRPPDPSIFA